MIKKKKGNKSMENLEKKEIWENGIRIVKGSIVAILLSLILLFLLACLLTYTNLQENIMSPVIIVISAISIFVGSSISTLKIKKNGLISRCFSRVLLSLCSVPSF